MKGVYGGSVINALENNVPKPKEAIATTIEAVVMRHKALWIDAAIRYRDALVHPGRGTQQLMFEIRVESLNGSPSFLHAVPPQVDETPIGQYAPDRVERVRQFSAELLKELRSAA